MDDQDNKDKKEDQKKHIKSMQGNYESEKRQDSSDNKEPRKDNDY